MDIIRINAYTPEKIIPTSPIAGTPPHLGGKPDNTTKEDPIIIDARIMAAASRFETTSSI
jgi:hypothetical protein